MVSLAFVSVGLGYEAILRLVRPPENIDGRIMSLVAGIGVFVNVCLAFILGEHHVHLPGGDHHHDHDHDHGHSHHQSNTDDAKNGEKTHKYHHHDHSHHHSHNDEKHFSNKNSSANEETILLVDCGDSTSTKEKKQRNVNLHAAYLHVLGDLAQSIAVFLGGVVIWLKPEWHQVDPILTLGFSALVLYSTIGVVKSSVVVLLEGTPESIEWEEVYNSIADVPNIRDVHDLHIWYISHGNIALSVHCCSADKKAISNINKVCKSFGINHTTIQINHEDNADCCDRNACISSSMRR
jgi:zinc transporter 2